MIIRASTVGVTILVYCVSVSYGAELTSLLPTQDQVFDAQTKPVSVAVPVRRCDALTIAECARDSVYTNVSFPNHLGHTEQVNAEAAVQSLQVFLRDAQCGVYLHSFLCLLAAPPCPVVGFEPLGPCRKVCTLARHHCLVTMKDYGVTWLPDFNCNRFPENNCIGHGHPLFPLHFSEKDGSLTDQVYRPAPKLDTLKKVFPKLDSAYYEMHPTKPSYTDPKDNRNPTRKQSVSSWRKAKNSDGIQNKMKSKGNNTLKSRANVNPELVATPSVESGKQAPGRIVKLRRYDITEPGDANQYRGWADVQGHGAANDYCRVIGTSSKTRFLSCALAGTTSHGHDYVSKRGVDTGHRNTWFMRDMDGDGRDDFCRCVGRGVTSHVSCMKAGELGFYSSPLQPGSEYTFKVKKFGPCQGKRFNPLLGIKE